MLAKTKQLKARKWHCWFFKESILGQTKKTFYKTSCWKFQSLVKSQYLLERHLFKGLHHPFHRSLRIRRNVEVCGRIRNFALEKQDTVLYSTIVLIGKKKIPSTYVISFIDKPKKIVVIFRDTFPSYVSSFTWIEAMRILIALGQP